MNITMTPQVAAVRPIAPALPCIEESYALLVLDRERLRLSLDQQTTLIDSLRAERNMLCVAHWAEIELSHAQAEAKAVLASLNHQ